MNQSHPTSTYGAFAKRPGSERDRREQHECECSRGEARRGERIDWREINRPDQLHDVLRISEERVLDSSGQREDRSALNGVEIALPGDRQSDSATGDQEQRKFLDDLQRTTQGPIVEKQKQERQCHEHLLRQQARCERCGCCQIPSRRARHRIDQERDHAEERAQGVLALRDPGHGLDVQRMNREKSGNERTAHRCRGHS